MRKSLAYFLFALGIIAGIVIAVPLSIRNAAAPYMYESASEVPTSTVAIVLGASVIRGEPSPILEERAEAALELYRAGKVQKILMTGDDSVRTHDEVTPVRKYLEVAGVAGEDIFLDHAGFDTYSSMYRARDVFEVRDAIIVTQAFHLPRAIFIAQNLGLKVYGVIADQRGEAIYNYMREVPASLKAALDLLITREPKYLGPRFPITGDGKETWE